MWSLMNEYGGSSCRCQSWLQRLGIWVSFSPWPTPSIVKWTRPNGGSIKLNVDGSTLDKPGRSGGGGVCRNHNGDFVFAFSVHYDIGSNTKAELRAVYNGLLLCSEFGFSQIEVKSVSLSMVALLNGLMDLGWHWGYWLQRIERLRAVGSVTFIHILREGNIPAYGMARSGSSSQSSFYTRHAADLPPKIRGAIFLDKVGLRAFRGPPSPSPSPSR
ncbi:uncharacterized protein LOC131254305 [Magnolia sinica]|uniref:uncharacterized protein LOC131254305 n=1 Tax=Magnolia sinica TaxID=86752 RepID=UPI0026587DD3|nr:uncharacterized protein LOC131254305 [Magnolia sinica]